MKRQKSLLIRLWLVVSALILAPSLLALAGFSRTVPVRMESQAKANADFYVDQTASAVVSTMELARDLAFNAMADNTLRESMQSRESYLVSRGRGALEQVIGSVAALQSSWSRYGLGAVYLFRQDGQFIFYAPGGSFVQEQRRMAQIAQTAADQSSARTLFRPEGGADGRAYFLLDYKNIDNLDLLGKLVMEVDVSALLATGELLELYPEACLALTDGEGRLLYGLGDELEDLLGQDARGYYQVSRPIGDYQLQLDVFLPRSAVYGDVWETSRWFMSLCAFILALTCGVALVGYWTLLRPLRSMEQTLDKLAESDYTARMPASGFRELAPLEHTFNHMADNLDSSFQDAYQKGVQLQESESRLLAAQINPHFVFNVLETINMRCVDAGLMDISRMVTDLAQLLRGNIGVGSGNQKVTIAQELNYVHYYIDLQRGRFGENLQCSVAYEDEEILAHLLPRLTLQPLVENAIVHGLEPRRGLGTVSVRLWEEENSIFVRVEDDGVGFDPQALDLENGTETGGHNHIALPNILRRLHLLYGDAARLDIRSAPGEGTTVLLELPIDDQEG